MATKKSKLTIKVNEAAIGRYTWVAVSRGATVACGTEDYRTPKLALAAWDRFFDKVTTGDIYLDLPA